MILPKGTAISAEGSNPASKFPLQLESPTVQSIVPYFNVPSASFTFRSYRFGAPAMIEIVPFTTLPFGIVTLTS